MNTPRIIFYVGKGGTGKSTVSALAALCLANEKKKVLLASFDAAHNLSDIFRLSLAHKPKKIVAGLLGAEIDQELLIKKYLTETQNELKRTYAYLTAFNLEGYFNILKYSPGLEEYALFLAFENLLTTYSDFDVLIFDMPPTALALKFFHLPFLSVTWIEHLEKLRNDIREKKEIINRIRPGQKESEGDKVLGRIKKMRERYRTAAGIFQNGAVTSVHAVLNDNALAVSETQRVHNALEKNDIALGKIIWNKVERKKHDDTNTSEKAALSPTKILPTLFPAASVLQLPESSASLTGISALNAFLTAHQLTPSDFL